MEAAGHRHVTAVPLTATVLTTSPNVGCFASEVLNGCHILPAYQNSGEPSTRDRFEDIATDQPLFRSIVELKRYDRCTPTQRRSSRFITMASCCNALSKTLISPVSLPIESRPGYFRYQAPSAAHQKLTIAGSRPRKSGKTVQRHAVKKPLAQITGWPREPPVFAQMLLFFRYRLRDWELSANHIPVNRKRPYQFIIWFCTPMMQVCIHCLPCPGSNNRRDHHRHFDGVHLGHRTDHPPIAGKKPDAIRGTLSTDLGFHGWRRTGSRKPDIHAEQPGREIQPVA